jgi:ubiquinol-cytochrome c reductase iron-sulfur subunit
MASQVISSSQIDTEAVVSRNTNAPDRTRRLLIRAASVASGAALAAAASPFLESLAPSARARAQGAPVDEDLASLAPGELKTVEWRGKPVWLLRRTPAMLASLERDTARLADPASSSSRQPPGCRNVYRSVRPEFFVATALCTHLGCVPTFRPDAGAADLGADWPGGFYCPCHGSKFDLAGRVFKDVPAPTNLVIPPYTFVAAAAVRIGDGEA